MSVQNNTVDVGTKLAVAGQLARKAIGELTEKVSALEKAAAAPAAPAPAPAGPTAEYRAAVQGLVDQMVEGEFVKRSEAERIVADGLASPSAILRSATVVVQEHRKRAEAFSLGGVGPLEKRAAGAPASPGRYVEPQRPSDALWEETYGTKRLGR